MTFTLLCGRIYQKEEKMVELTEFKEMLKGVTAIMVTPYTDEGEVSEERLRNHINFWMKDGLIIIRVDQVKSIIW